MLYCLETKDFCTENGAASADLEYGTLLADLVLNYASPHKDCGVWKADLCRGLRLSTPNISIQLSQAVILEDFADGILLPT